MAAITSAVVGGAIVAGGTIAAGAMSANAQKKAANRAMDAAHEAKETYEEIHLPTLEEMQINLEQIKNSGNLTPEQEHAITQQQSELAKIQADPELRDAQMQALLKLQQVGNEGGMTAVDKAQMNEIMTQAGNQEQANRNALVQNFQQRGMGGSGMEMAAQLMNNQSAGQNAANQGFNVAAQAQQRALQALTQAGTMGAAIENNRFQQDSAKAQAQDAINRFNAQNQQDVQGRNVQRTNYANERNLNNQQQIDAQNAALKNQQEIYNKGLHQQQFDNDLQIASGKANALNKVANAAEAKGKADAALWGAVGEGAGKIGGSLMGYGMGKLGK